jgi:hypothetical protein
LAVEYLFPRNWITLQSYYLFVYPEAYDDAITPLIKQKKARGHRVSTCAITENEADCDFIRLQIYNWYTATPFHADHYCLLVGDVDAIPFCTAGTWIDGNYHEYLTDDLYGSMYGNDLEEEVYVGRLSVDDEADLAVQISKILGYENDNEPGPTHYNQALLVAHRQGAPQKYVGNCEAVRTASYSVPPTFHTLYGHQSWVTDEMVRAYINGGMGIVTYRGHGGYWKWTNWNTRNEYFSTYDVESLDNGTKTPVVWAFTCGNSALDSDGDCIAEVWMEQTDGAVSHYGATRPSFTGQNHVLNLKMHKAVYDKDITRQARTIAWAENKMALKKGEHNAWKYLLLGDPEMEIRRRNPLPMFVVRPDYLVLSEGDTLRIEVREPDRGTPVHDALVAAWKPGSGPRDEDEVFDNRYTDEHGIARIPCEPQSPGWLYFTIQDDLGTSMMDRIFVVATVEDADDVSSEPTFHLVVRPTLSQSELYLDFGKGLDEPAKINIYDVAGRTVRTIEATTGTSGVLWKGTDNAGHGVSPGIYFARLSKGDLVLNARLVVIK